jgi:hypothetical protein
VHSAGTGLRAIARLEQAAAVQGNAAVRFQAFMFEQLKPAADVSTDQRAAAAEETLGSVLADLDVGNVLVTAGRAVGETGEAAEAEAGTLDDALLRLQNTKNAPTSERRSRRSLLEATRRCGRSWTNRPLR